MKHCPRCCKPGETLPRDIFYATGAYCRRCTKVYFRERRRRQSAETKQRLVDAERARRQSAARDPAYRARVNAYNRRRYRKARQTHRMTVWYGKAPVAWKDATGARVPALDTYPQVAAVALVWSEQGWRQE